MRALSPSSHHKPQTQAFEKTALDLATRVICSPRCRIGPDCGLFFDIAARAGPSRSQAQTLPETVPDAVIRSRSLPAQAEIRDQSRRRGLHQLHCFFQTQCNCHPPQMGATTQRGTRFLGLFSHSRP
ncbi:hypothetical protein D3C76_1468610 [compost metagenome]